MSPDILTLYSHIYFKVTFLLKIYPIWDTIKNRHILLIEIIFWTSLIWQLIPNNNVDKYGIYASRQTDRKIDKQIEQMDIVIERQTDNIDRYCNRKIDRQMVQMDDNIIERQIDILD